MPRVVHDLPEGERRIHQESVGIRATIVAGEVAFRDGARTGAPARAAAALEVFVARSMRRFVENGEWRLPS
jgi:N-acyl-D-aspartate/D-glutamate deacylase